MLTNLKRIVVVVGHYGSGKTNFSVNLAVDLKAAGRDVILVDLDIVNPYFRSADFGALLEEKGIGLIAPVYARSNLDVPALDGRLDAVIESDKTLVIDVGGDDAGAAALGRYSAMTPNLYVASGFNKWGMTTSMVAAQLLTDIITGKKSPYEAVFSPSRSMLHAQLGVNAVEAVKNLLTVSPRRCSHLGCALKWNPQERSWDCPCHGSRFEENGRLIDNPATKNLRSH